MQWGELVLYCFIDQKELFRCSRHQVWIEKMACFTRTIGNTIFMYDLWGVSMPNLFLTLATYVILSLVTYNSRPYNCTEARYTAPKFYHISLFLSHRTHIVLFVPGYPGTGTSNSWYLYRLMSFDFLFITTKFSDIRYCKMKVLSVGFYNWGRWHRLHFKLYMVVKPLSVTRRR